ncbi:MAG: hypothetical protein JWQ11_2201 [Rhizobacter sp.]|nr:hypothetical protein [Rhizobacter sp.]
MLSHLTSCWRPSSPRRTASPIPCPDRRFDGTPTAPLKTVDLTRFDATLLARARPKGLLPAGNAQRLELKFPPGMAKLPRWALELEPSVIRLPAFSGLSVAATSRGLKRLVVGGERVRLVSAPEGCEVSVPNPRHVSAVKVEWIDSRTGVRRVGRPQGHINRVAWEPTDTTVPRNCSVDFATPGYTGQRIVCRQIGAYIDRQWSDSQVQSGASDTKPGQSVHHPDEHAAIASRLASLVRRRLATVRQLQAEIPRAYDARFFDLAARSPNATIVENRKFAGWIRAQFKEMSLPDQRTYLWVSRAHVMNFALTVRRGPNRAPTFLDPNLHTQPSSIETTNEAEIASWSLDRFISAHAMSIYYPLENDGTPVDVSMMIQTPRGQDRVRFDAGADKQIVAKPRLSFFPRTMPPADHADTFSGMLGSHLRQVRPLLDRLTPDRVFDHLFMSGLIGWRLSNGASAEITTYFETIAHLVSIQKLDAYHAAALATPNMTDYPVHGAVIEGRPEALERYRQGLEQMMAAGWLTDEHNDWFRPLFTASALEVVNAHAANGTPLQKEAASRYKNLMATLEAGIGLPEPESPAASISSRRGPIDGGSLDEDKIAGVRSKVAHPADTMIG